MKRNPGEIRHESETEMYNEKYAGADLKRPRTAVIEFIEKHLTQSNHCLDLGCGEGRHSRYLANKGIALTGVDLSEVGLEKARASLIGYDKANFLSADIHRLPFENESFDSLISNRVLDYNDSAGLEQAFSEISRILKDQSPIFLTLRSSRQSPKTSETLVEKNPQGGTTYLNKNNQSLNHYFTLEEIESLAKKFNLEIIEAKESTKENQNQEEKSEWQIILKKINYEKQA